MDTMVTDFRDTPLGFGTTFAYDAVLAIAYATHTLLDKEAVRRDDQLHAMEARREPLLAWQWAHGPPASAPGSSGIA